MLYRANSRLYIRSLFCSLEATMAACLSRKRTSKPIELPRGLIAPYGERTHANMNGIGLLCERSSNAIPRWGTGKPIASPSTSFGMCRLLWEVVLELSPIGEGFPRSWAAISFTSFQRAFLSSKEVCDRQDDASSLRARSHGFDPLLSRHVCVCLGLVVEQKRWRTKHN